MRIGFTGTSKGMTPEQLRSVRLLLRNGFVEEFHHGDCIGADSQAHAEAMMIFTHIYIHPPINKKARAFCKGGTVLKEKSYIERNHDIVNAVDMMIATPKGNREELRSGTWATIRYARKQKVKLCIIYPSGRRVTEEEL